jgi:hypothetical protein
MSLMIILDAEAEACLIRELKNVLISLCKVPNDERDAQWAAAWGSQVKRAKPYWRQIMEAMSGREAHARSDQRSLDGGA